MNRKRSATLQVGDLITAAYDAAAQVGGDSREVSRLANQAVAHLLSHARLNRSHH